MSECKTLWPEGRVTRVPNRFETSPKKLGTRVTRPSQTWGTTLLAAVTDDHRIRIIEFNRGLQRGGALKNRQSDFIFEDGLQA